MALIKDYFEPRLGVTITACYWKVEIDNGIHGGKSKLFVRLNCFKDKATADTNQNKYTDFDFNFVPSLNYSAQNFIAQAYVYVKTLPEFSGAVDV